MPGVCRTTTSLAVGTRFATLNPRTNGAIDVEQVLPTDADVAVSFKRSNPKFNADSEAGVDIAVRGALHLAANHVRG